MNLPNLLTLSRIFLVPLVVAGLLNSRGHVDWGGTSIDTRAAALVIFLIAAATDMLDGYLARRWSQTTTIGTLLDPIADKLLVSAALVSLVELQVLPAWMAIVQIGREFAVSGFRQIAASVGYTISASQWGKWKMVGQVLMLILLMASLLDAQFRAPGIALAYAVTAVSLWGALDYFFKFWRGIAEATKRASRSRILLEERRTRRQQRLQKQHTGD